MDYYQMKREVLEVVGSFTSANTSQRKNFYDFHKSSNFVTPDIWGLLSLNGGKYVAEVSSGIFLERYVYGVTVCVKNEDGEYCKAPYDSGISRCVHGTGELREYLEYLNDPEQE